MSSIPSNLSRSPSLLISQIQLQNITRTNLGLFEAQAQLSTGRALLRPSDDPVAAVTVAALDDSIERSEQRLRNIDFADTNLALIETSLAEANDLLLSAKSIASEQVNLGSSSVERANQAQVIDSLLEGLLEQMNRTAVGNSLFGGSRISSAPFESFGTGILYTGEFERLTTDLALGRSVPVTLNGIEAIGQPGRIRGGVDLNPQLTLDTPLNDLNGARGLGIARGVVQLSIAGAPEPLLIDLTTADTAEDVVTRIEASIRQYETVSGTTVLAPGGVGVAGERLTLAVEPGQTLTFSDIGAGTTAQDLGLADAAGLSFDAANADGADLDPRLTLGTRVASLAGLAGAMDQIEIANGGRRVVVDLSGAETIEAIKNRIETAGTGVRVEINADGTGIDVINLVSAPPGDGLTIAEVAGGSDTADLLGIRTLSRTTRSDALNDGRGVSVRSGGVDPQTGLADPTLDIDFSIELGDGRVITVNLRPEDAGTIGGIIDRINAEAAAQGVSAADFSAALGTGAQGIVLRQNAAFAGTITPRQQNNSQALFDLGLGTGTYDAASATLAGEDRSQIVTDTAFTRLIQLRDALLADDTSGITLAGEKLEGVIDGIAQTRGLIGSFGQRLETARRREEDANLLEQSMRSELRDLDFAEGATRLTQLQNQLEAALRSTNTASQLSLLDFLG
ncbi:MAG: flagellin [Phycisphaerales bacterium]